ncbi:hypothetical protein [Anaplasma phagocytophilum]|uniref:hypothetical protein n=1 Tax=Anaplasma phagocytophilum TaxID=948 RepID=UPI0015DE02DC|nr:hypothetical protein [Anaplasma phagocytophilum]
MMLLLGRLINLLPLLPKPPGKISFSLPMLLKFLTLRLIRRFVMGLMLRHRTQMGHLPHMKKLLVVTKQRNVVVLAPIRLDSHLANLQKY